jgi:hypothetical protein
MKCDGVYPLDNNKKIEEKQVVTKLIEAKKKADFGTITYYMRGQTVEVRL